MKIKIIACGKTTEKYLKGGIEVYLDRLKHYTKVEWLELPDVKAAKHLTSKQVMELEAEKIKAQLQPNDTLICLDENGKEFSSVDFSNFIGNYMVRGTQTLVLLIGGPYGIDESIKRQAATTISLSQMTFTHQMVRLIVAEQLYRAMTILRNEPYHHN